MIQMTMMMRESWNAFTTTVDPIDEGLETVDDEEDLVDSKFEKMDNQDDMKNCTKFLRSMGNYIG